MFNQLNQITMQTKFTKGEWESKGFQSNSNGFININFPDGVISVYGGCITEMNDVQKEIYIQKAEANAKLIAAAPDNFEQNVLNLEFMKRLMQMDYIPKGELAARILQSEQAIEKATK